MNREKQIEEEIKILEEESFQIKARRTIKCSHCEKRTPIRKVTVLAHNHYISPTGCMGGDYWVSSKQFTWWCPKCGEWNKAHDGGDNPYSQRTTPLYKWMSIHRPHFAEVLQYHNERDITMEELRKKQDAR